MGLLGVKGSLILESEEGQFKRDLQSLGPAVSVGAGVGWMAGPGRVCAQLQWAYAPGRGLVSGNLGGLSLGARVSVPVRREQAPMRRCAMTLVLVLLSTGALAQAPSQGTPGTVWITLRPQPSLALKSPRVQAEGKQAVAAGGAFRVDGLASGWVAINASAEGYQPVERKAAPCRWTGQRLPPARAHPRAGHREGPGPP